MSATCVQGTVWGLSSERSFLSVVTQKDGDQAGSGTGVSEAESWQMTWKRTPTGFERRLEVPESLMIFGIRGSWWASEEQAGVLGLGSFTSSKSLDFFPLCQCGATAVTEQGNHEEVLRF